MLLGKRHPGALGRPFTEVWFDILADVGPILERAFAGESTHVDDLRLVTNRHGYQEEAHFAFSYTPVRDEAGAVAGMFCACVETTGKVQAEQALRESATQQAFRAELGDRLRALADPGGGHGDRGRAARAQPRRGQRRLL